MQVLVVFRSLLETRSVTATANNLAMSQPAVSRALAKLREVFDDPLFVQSSREMVPTEYAVGLSTPLSHAIDAVEYFLRPQSFVPAESDRRFRIAATDYCAATCLPAVARRLAEHGPRIKLEIVPVTRDCFRALGDGQLDLMLYSDDPVPEGCLTRDLFWEDFACLVRSGHPVLTRLKKQKGKPKRISMDDYLAWPHALVSVFGGRRGVVDRELEARGQSRTIQLWLPYFSTTAHVIEASDLILTLPRRGALAFAAHADLEVIEPPFDFEPWAFRLVWHERSETDLGAAWLRDQF